MRFRWMLMLVLAATLSAACAPSQDAAGSNDVEETSHASTRLEPGEYTFTTTDGIEMPYVVSGSGDTTVLLVHCWMCDRTFWNRQLPALEPAYQVVAVDLPGHGEGGDGRENWTVLGFGEDVAGLIAELDLHDIILAGHSMGGPVSLRAAALSPERVLGVVAVDTLQNAEFKYPEEFTNFILQQFEEDFRAGCTGMMGQMFDESEPAEIVDEVRRKGCEESNPEAGVALIHDFVNLDMPTLFEEAGVPIRGINAVNPQFATEIEINRKYGDYDAVEMKGVGHFLHMTRPDEFNEHFLAALADIEGLPG